MLFSISVIEKRYIILLQMLNWLSLVFQFWGIWPYPDFPRHPGLLYGGISSLGAMGVNVGDGGTRPPNIGLGGDAIGDIPQLLSRKQSNEAANKLYSLFV